MPDGGSIFLFQRVLPHYRVPVFGSLDERLGGRLVVCHGAPPAKGYVAATVGNGTGPEPPPFRRVDLANRWCFGDRLVWQRVGRPFRIFGTPGAVISEGGPRQLSLFPLLAYTRAAGIPLVLWNHAGSRRRDVSSSDPRDLVHRWLYRTADAFLCYTEQERDALVRHCDPCKLFVARNTIAASSLFAIRRKLERQGRASVRRRLGLAEHRLHLLFLGSLVPEKRAPEAIEVADFLRATGRDVGLIVVGDGPQGEAMKRLAHERGVPVRFAGAVHDQERLAEYCFAAAVLLLPGSVGLAVNQAFALGLPVVTRATGQEGPFHGPEIVHVRDRETGRQVSGRGIAPLAAAIREILRERALYARRCLAYAEAFLHERHMVEAVVRALEHVGVPVSERGYSERGR